MKIAYFVHGRGRGHAIRTLSVIPALVKSGHTLTIFAGGMAADVLGSDAIKIESVMPGLKGIKTLIKRIGEDKLKLKKENPDLVISDGDAPCLFAAKRLKIPSIALSHGIIIPYFHHTISMPFFQFLKESINVWISSNPAQIKIAVHFDQLKPKYPNVFLAQPQIPKIEIGQTSNFIVSYFRDSNGSEIIGELINKGIAVHNFGEAIEGAINHNYDPIAFRKYFSRCKGVVASAGFNLVSEALHYRKPMLAMYKSSDFEQWLNATYLSKINGYSSSSFEKLNFQSIDQFTENIETKFHNDFETSPLPILPELLTQEIIPNMFNK